MNIITGIENMVFVYFIVNIVSVTILAYSIYYKRYNDKEGVTSYMMFNIFVFAVITALFNTSDNMSLGLGFGMFAILSLITLRSAPMRKTEITYFFGSLSLAIINAIGLESMLLLLICNAIIVAGAWIIDNPRILKGIYTMKVVLDHIPEGILENSEDTKKKFSKQFGIDVISYSVGNINYVKDTARIKLTYHSTNTS